MFRDESSKVMQKAHAQWGSSGSPVDLRRDSAPTSASASSTGSSSSWMSSSSASTEAWTSESQSTASDSPPSDPPLPPHNLVPTRIPRRVDLNIEQRGMQFYINRYLMNHPDSPRTREQVAAYFANADAAQNVMIAVGLAGMSNLLGNKNVNLLARSKYITALKDTGQLIASNNPAGLVARMRSVVTLALFEFIPYQMTDALLPPAFFDTLEFCKQLMQESPESCSVNLALAIARLLQLSAVVEHTALTDERPTTDNLIQQFLIIENAFHSLESRLLEAFPFTENRGEYPPEAVFRGKWHAYNEIWGARIWNHYRWARILANQRLVEFIDHYPISSRQFIPPPRRMQCYTTIERLAEDILVSASSHWHHPILDAEVTQKFGAKGQGRSGAMGLPSLLWHLTTAGCAPNVPLEFWSWAYNVLQVVWRQMGMQHALALSEMMEEHRTRLEKEAIKHKLELEGEGG
ncbi:hypothetical protein AAE478_003355 [Parahypoxylon ruwenzoriense]